MSPGRIALFGSGETSASGGKVFDLLAQALPAALHVAVLETPAGFELNAAQVAGRVAQFLRLRLQNYNPDVILVPARKRGTPFSPDDPAITAPLLCADLIVMGPGSPTYAVKQLASSLAWHRLIARHRLGAALAVASAAAIAVGAVALPVYEIYKVGDDPFWHGGLDLFGAYGLKLAIVPHWDNTDGGQELDTSHCFMGQDRFDVLQRQLPDDTTVLGLDEQTMMICDLGRARADVYGKAGVTVLRDGRTERYVAGRSFDLAELGDFRLPAPEVGIPPVVWEEANQACQVTTLAQQAAQATLMPPPEVTSLLAEREAARARRDWAAADDLRQRALALGWQIQDMPNGPRCVPA